MSDYIDREVAIMKLVNLTNNSDMPEYWHVGLSAGISALYRVPSVDVAESIDIVRCKECAYWHDWGNGEFFCGRLDGGIGSDADDFCSYGERKE